MRESESFFLEAQGIKKSYVQGTTSVDVLRGVSVRFEQGRTYAITGVSGSGKSTFMHLLAGLDVPDEGAILLNGVDIFSFSRQEQEQFRSTTLGLVFQLPYLIQELSVIENVMLKGLIVGVEQRLCYEQAHDLLKRVGLDHKIDHAVSSLSGGQQQRVALARALFNKPTFFIADEPTGNLDHETAKIILALLIECQKEWLMGLIISSHDPFVAQSMQEVWHMSDGVLEKVKEQR